MAERAASNIPVEIFRPALDDFDEWIGMFESAVELATNPQSDDRKYELCMNWLPIKLDDATRMIHSNCSSETWIDLKTELKSLLVTPEERYNWRSGRNRIVWDGRESFHVLATRIKRSVDRHDENPRESDYFHNFRLALPGDYRQAIDWGNNAETLAEAKRLAFKCQAALSGKDELENMGATSAKSVAFIGASMSEDRLMAIERFPSGHVPKG